MHPKHPRNGVAPSEPTPKSTVGPPVLHLRQSHYPENHQRRRILAMRKNRRNQNTMTPEAILRDQVREAHRSVTDRPDAVDFFPRNILVPPM